MSVTRSECLDDFRVAGATGERRDPCPGFSAESKTGAWVVALPCCPGHTGGSLQARNDIKDFAILPALQATALRMTPVFA